MHQAFQTQVDNGIAARMILHEYDFICGADKLNVRGTFFWSEITRPIANVTLSITPALITRQRQNLGRTRSRGVDIEAEARVTAACEELYRAAIDLGGTVTGEHGIGVARLPFLELQRGPGAVRVMRQIKSALDPLNLLNPGRAI